MTLEVKFTHNSEVPSSNPSLNPGHGIEPNNIGICHAN